MYRAYKTDLQMYVIGIRDRSDPNFIRCGTINVVAESMEKAVRKVAKIKPELIIQQAVSTYNNVVVPWISDGYYDKDSDD